MIVNKVLKICSKDCEFAVAFIEFLPLKYPLITEESATITMEGAKHLSVSSASGIKSKLLDIKLAPKNNIKVQIKPIIPTV